MHQSVAPDLTDVTFGVLSDPMNVPINSVSLSLLRSSLVELFLQQSNLTLTTSIFGNASMFEILKVPGGITVIPVQLGPIIQRPLILFNFTLHNSTVEILDNFADFKNELKLDLNLRPNEVCPMAYFSRLLFWVVGIMNLVSLMLMDFWFLQ